MKELTTENTGHTENKHLMPGVIWTDGIQKRRGQ